MSSPAPEQREFPPAFPAWLREREPVLAEEDTNGLFQAFRERRLRRIASRRWYRQPRAAIAIVVGSLVILMPVFSLLPGGANYVSLCILPVILLAVVFGVQKSGAERLPDRLGELFMLPNLKANAMRDLWQIPVRGRDVLMAMYLESREQAIPGTTFMAVVGTIMVPAIWVASQGVYRGMILDATLVAPAFLYAASGLRFGLLAVTRDQAIDVLIAARVASWKPPMTFEIRKMLVQLGKAIFVMLRGVFIIGIVAVALVPIAHYIGQWHFSLPNIPALRALFTGHSRVFGIVIANLLFVVIGFTSRLNRNQQRSAERMEKLLAQGDELYADFMRRKVLHDDPKE